LENEQYDYSNSKNYPYGFVKFQALLDEITYRRYCSTFSVPTEESAASPKGMPPKEWLKGSESYFDKKKREKQE